MPNEKAPLDETTETLIVGLTNQRSSLDADLLLLSKHHLMCPVYMVLHGEQLLSCIIPVGRIAQWLEEYKHDYDLVLKGLGEKL